MKKQLYLNDYMHKCCIFLVFFLLFFFSTGNAQSLKRQVIGSSGSSVSENGTTVQQTTGQAYGTTSNYGNSIRYNPGFQQPIFRIETIKSTINATVFPNPTSKQVTIETDKVLQNVVIQVIEMGGKLVINEKMNEFKSYTINCSDWANGIYMITLSDPKDELYSSKLIIAK